MLLFVSQGSRAPSASLSLLLLPCPRAGAVALVPVSPCPVPPHTAARSVPLGMLTLFCLLQRNPITKRPYEITLTCTVVSLHWLLEPLTC